MKTSLFDLYKVGIGPSSSHTMGPMRAARTFLLELESRGLLTPTVEVHADLYGSLALTGAGHGTDRAVILGLLGEEASKLDPGACNVGIYTLSSPRIIIDRFGCHAAA